MDSTKAFPIATIDLGRLEKKQPSEIAKLIETLHNPGFFFLDVANATISKDIPELESKMYKASENYFHQPANVKSADARQDRPPSSDVGYNWGPADEFYEMPTDELRHGKLQLPQGLKHAEGDLTIFQFQCDAVTRMLLAQVEESLGIHLQEHHLEMAASETAFKLVSEPTIDFVSDVVENMHCDSGTWTMLFYDSWGVQMFLGDKAGPTDNPAEWAFLPPPPKGCVLVHGGNSLERMTAAKVRSPLHRVTQPSDGAAERHFLCYLLRPIDSAVGAAA